MPKKLPSSAPASGSALGVEVRLTLMELNLLVRSMRSRKYDSLCFLNDSGIAPEHPLYGEIITAANRLDARATELQEIGQGANFGTQNIIAEP